jgi:hypothetical protein
VDYPDDSGCSGPDDGSEQADAVDCDHLIPLKKYPLFFKRIIRLDAKYLPGFIQKHQETAIDTKIGVMRYLFCIEPEILLEIEPPICLKEPVAMGMPEICPGIDCFIDGPGCMDPYQYTRVYIPDSVLTTVGLWSEGLISDKEFVFELEYMVDNELIAVEKERPKKIRYLPKLPVGTGLLIAGALIVAGFAFSSLIRVFRKKR